MSDIGSPSPLARERSSSAFNRRSEFTNDIGTYIKSVETQTIGGPLVLVNQKQKKKPYDVKFSKFQPKIQPQIKYTAKQAFRQYKSKVEPKLKSKIQIDEEDDLVKKIKEAFGIKSKNTNYNEVETAPAADIFTNFQDPRTFQEKNEIIDLDGNIIKGRPRQMEPLPEEEINGYLYSKIDAIRYQQLEEKLKEIESDTALTDEQKEAAKIKLEREYVDDHRAEIAKYQKRIRPTSAQKLEAEYERARIFEAVDEIKFAVKVNNLTARVQEVAKKEVGSSDKPVRDAALAVAAAVDKARDLATAVRDDATGVLDPAAGIAAVAVAVAPAAAGVAGPAVALGTKVEPQEEAQ
jgi:hypothetical protein